MTGFITGHVGDIFETAFQKACFAKQKVEPKKSLNFTVNYNNLGFHCNSQ